jgi:hypothetical protein
MNFSQALGYVIAGHKVRRKTKLTMYICVLPYQGIVEFRTSDDGVIWQVPYVGYSDDLLVDDWEIISG